MNIYEIDQRIREAFDRAVDPETGEIVDDGAYDTFMQLDMARDEKIENVGVWIKDLKAEAAALRAEEQALAERRRAKESKTEELKRYLQYALDGEKYESTRVKIGYRRSTAVEVDPTMIPVEYLRYREPEPDKRKLTADLKEGKQIPGAVLVEKQNLVIR